MVIAVVIVVVFIGGVFGFAALQPERLAIERTTHIAAPPQAVFALVSDFHQWPRWAPQERTDPKMQRRYSGAPAGIGAASQWASAGSADPGHMQIIAATPPHRITVQVDFMKPFTAHNRNEFSFTPDGPGTSVRWAMGGTNVFMARVMRVFVNMGRMIGAHFEAGLRDLKAAVQGASGAPAQADRE